MPDLIAQGPDPGHRWRRKLHPGVSYLIGRQTEGWSAPWDARISRRHVEVVYRDGQLVVTALPAARNPVFVSGQRSSQFTILPGEHFVIGETTFTLVEERVHVSLDVPMPAGERTFSIEELRARPFREADKRIAALARLPDVIRGAASDQELFERLVNLLLTGIERAAAAAVVVVDCKSPVPGSRLMPGPGDPEAASGNAAPATSNANDGSADPIRVLHWDRRILAGLEFQPSERLIRQAVASGESVVHVWNLRDTGEAAAGTPSGDGPFTVSEGVDWAFCTPVPGPACQGWALYVTGSSGGDYSLEGTIDAESLRDEVKFAELTAATLGGVRESRLLAARQASLRQFFSPLVLDALGSQDPDQALAPREADVTVLFCDLRGFSRESERSAGDLFGLLRRVSQALGVMTRHILESGGVVGDFHGDAAMGFWGWPLAQPDSVARACQAALGIRAAFAGDLCQDRALSDFRVGIGIASGRAVAGKIGTVDQVKVTVFGPVVNLAARLETMTRQLQASILIDPPTAAVIAASVPRSVCRVRRLAKVRPVGFAAAIEVSELLPPEAACPELTDQHLASYEAALAAFEAKDWPLALKHLHAVPPDDLAKDFLMLFIARHSRVPPPGWDGVIPLEAK